MIYVCIGWIGILNWCWITHTHPFNGPFSGTTRVSRYQKGEPIWILLEQETVSGSGISWAVYKSAPRSRQITTPAPHHSVFLQAGCPSCHPTNSVKALKAQLTLKLKYIHRGHCDARQKRRNSVQLSTVSIHICCCELTGQIDRRKDTAVLFNWVDHCRGSAVSIHIFLQVIS